MRAALALLVLLASGPAWAQEASAALGRFQILHNAPDPEIETVDVYVNGVLLPNLDDMAFRTATPFLSVSEGTAVTVVVAADTSSGILSPLAVGSFVAQEGLDHRVVISGVLRPHLFAPNPDGRSTRLEAKVLASRRGFGIDPPGPSAPSTRFALLQGVPDLPTVSYDVYTAIGTGVVGLRAGYGGGSFNYFLMPADDHIVRVRAAGLPEFAAWPDHLPFRDNETALAFSSGFAFPSANQNGPGATGFALYEDGTLREVPRRVLPVSSQPPVQAPAPLAAHPNPAQDRATLSVGVPAPVEMTVHVIDVQGREVWTETATLGGGRLHALDVSNWPAGTYVVRVTEASGTARHASLTVVR